MVMLALTANRIAVCIVRGFDIFLIITVTVAGSPALNQHTDLMGQTYVTGLRGILKGQLKLCNNKNANN